MVTSFVQVYDTWRVDCALSVARNSGLRPSSPPVRGSVALDLSAHSGLRPSRNVLHGHSVARNSGLRPSSRPVRGPAVIWATWWNLSSTAVSNAKARPCPGFPSWLGPRLKGLPRVLEGRAAVCCTRPYLGIIAPCPGFPCWLGPRLKGLPGVLEGRAAVYCTRLNADEGHVQLYF